MLGSVLIVVGLLAVLTLFFSGSAFTQRGRVSLGFGFLVAVVLMGGAFVVLLIGASAAQALVVGAICLGLGFLIFRR